MYSKILVPTDGSALSRQAAAVAIDFARAHGAQLVVLCVAQPDPVMLADSVMAAETGSDSRILLEAARRNVDEVLEQARAAGVACLGTVALSFMPHEEIIRATAEHGCDLVCMASHGRRGLSRLLAGSVTQNVLAYSKVPVLVLRPGWTA
jgi:nucleotide-binding universal stress UspA family protein